MRNATMTIWVMVAVLIVSGQVMAFTQYNDGGTYNISTTINDDVWVDWEAPGMGTTVNMVDGGYVPISYSLQSFNDSKINFMWGSQATYFYAHDNSQVTVSAG